MVILVLWGRFKRRLFSCVLCGQAAADWQQAAAGSRRQAATINAPGPTGSMHQQQGIAGSRQQTEERHAQGLTNSRQAAADRQQQAACISILGRQLAAGSNNANQGLTGSSQAAADRQQQEAAGSRQHQVCVRANWQQ